VSYKNDSDLVILNRYGKAEGDATAELYETYDRIRDLTISGPTLGGSGVGKFGSMLVNLARMFGSPAFLPTFGSEAITVPGTTYYGPAQPGTAQGRAGQAGFGLAPFSQSTGLINGGAAPVGFNFISQARQQPLGTLSRLGAGRLQLAGSGLAGIGDTGFSLANGGIGGLSNGIINGGASPVGAIGTGGALAAGGAAALGYGRNWVLPAAGIASGIGGLLTTLGPFFGPFGLAGAAAGSMLNGISGAVLASFQRANSQLLANADTILTNKVHNLETVIKMLGAQQDVLKKLLKEGLDGDKKILDNI
jgi:hypothetical protein